LNVEKYQALLLPRPKDYKNSVQGHSIRSIQIHNEDSEEKGAEEAAEQGTSPKPPTPQTILANDGRGGTKLYYQTKIEVRGGGYTVGCFQ
jgi:hypothetical protein